MLFEEFQDGRHGGHLGYQNGTILAILNLCYCDASRQVSAQSDLRFGRRCRLKNFKMDRCISERNDFSDSESHVAQMPPIKFWLNLTYGLGGDVV